MNTDRFNYLLKAYLKGTISEKDGNELLELMENGLYNEELETMMSKTWDALKMITDERETGGRERSLSAIKAAVQKIEATGRITAGRVTHRKFLVAAAAAFFILFTGAFFLLQAKKNREKNELPATSAATKEISPGTDKAILTLSNGTAITLDATATNTLQQDKTEIRQGGGSLQYHKQVGAATAYYNTLSTPRGGQYQVVLADGTHVWLNAQTSLTYPTAFTGSERVVELTGEAYFEIAKDASKPFRVKVNNTVVQALGTHFNIMGYTDEATTNTTLTEGSVKIWSRGGEKMLVPGQQSVTDNKNGETGVTEPDMDKVLAWKAGFFEFNDINVYVLIRQIARWYDVEIKYDRLNEKISYGGRINKNIPLSKMIKILNGNGLSCSISNRTLTFLND